jgi:hypothetical protein
LDLHKKSHPEIEEGAVLVIGGQYKDRVGFYCLQNEQTYDMHNIANCPDCKLTKGKLTRSISNVSESETIFDSPVEIEMGSYCMSHRIELVEHDMAVIYWDRPYGDDYSLVHPSELVQISSTEYARYARECKIDVEEAFLRLLEALEKS